VTPSTPLTEQNVDLDKLTEHIEKISRLRDKIGSRVICFLPMLHETPTRLIDDAMMMFLEVFSRNGLARDLQDDYFVRSTVYPAR
jgi:hypothetical protein